MKILRPLVFASVFFTIQAVGQMPEMEQPEAHIPVRFEAIDVYMDSGEAPLAAGEANRAA